MSVARSSSTDAHFPLTPLAESPMEFLGPPRLSGACNLLEVPSLSSQDVDSDEGEEVIGIRPKSSPLPRRRSADFDDYSEPETPPSTSRRVSFADALGLSLVHVKEFDTWDLPKLPGYESSDGESNEAEEYDLSLVTFALPVPSEELLAKVQDQKVELETMELLPGTTIVRGVVRVLNISYSKAVYIRTTFDAWTSHFDLLAEYISGSSDGLMDCFSFRLTLVPPFEEPGVRFEFCVRYETPVGTFWANNNSKNYTLLCHRRRKGQAPKDANKKSCLKSVSKNSQENISALDAPSGENVSAVTSAVEEEVTKGLEISDGQSETSADGGQKLQSESRRFSSQRSSRKARARDHCGPRSVGGSDTERDESPPEAKLAAENPKEVFSVLSFSEENSTSEPPPFVSISPASVVHDTLEATHKATHDESEKSESHALTDLACGEKSDREIPAGRLHAEGPLNVKMFVSRTQEETDINYEPDVVAEPDDAALSARISESLVGQSEGVTFGTVVAPLYNQMFGRVERDSQGKAECKNSLWASMDAIELGQSYIGTSKKEESCCIGSAGVRHKIVQGSVIEAQESNQRPTEEEERSEKMTENNRVDSADQEPANTSELSLTTNTEMCLWAGVQTDDPSGNYQEQTIQTPQPVCVHSQTESENLVPGVGTSFLPHQQEHGVFEADHKTSKGYESVNESNTEASTCKLKPKSVTDASAEAHNLLEPLHDLNLSQNHHSSEEEELSNGKDFSTQNEANDVEDLENSAEGEVCKEEMETPDTLEYEPRSAELKEDFTDVKNWEMMVEDEEKMTVADYEEVRLDNKVDQGQFEDEIAEETIENRYATQTAVEKPVELSEDVTTSEEAEDPVGSKDRVEEDKTWKIVAGADVTNVEEELEDIQAAKPAEAGEEESQVDDEETRMDQEEFNIKEVEELELEEEANLSLNNGDGATLVWRNQEKPREESKKEDNLDEFCVYETDSVALDVDVERMTISDGENEATCADETFDLLQSMADGNSVPVGNVQESRVTDGDSEDRNPHSPPEMDLSKEDEDATRDDSKPANVFFAVSQDAPDSDEASHDSASADSDSDDEVELYMHCLRAVHVSSRAAKDKDTGFSGDRRSSVNRRKQLPLPMPSITEALDEDRHHGCLQDNRETLNPAEFEPAAAEAEPSVSSEQEINNGGVLWWRDTFSLSNISKTLLFTAVLLVFGFVAYHYDFLACFGLYLISLVWLCCQRDTQPVKKYN